MSAQIKICKDCKHYENELAAATDAAKFGVSFSPHLCARPELLDVVTGHRTEARNNRDGECGKEGRFWEAK